VKTATTHSPTPAKPRPPWRINRRLLDFCRTVHIYFTMLGLLVLLLFGFTGFTLNHEDWFGSATPRVTEKSGQVPVDLVQKTDTLRIVENVRQIFHISGAMTSFDELDDHYSAAFRSPGESWDVEIEKSSGRATLHIEAYNFFAVLNNLHRGQFTGWGWHVIIDICAILIVVACLTGVVLWLALPKRRRLGTAILAIGTVGALVVYLFLVPGADEVAAHPKVAAPAAQVTNQPAP